MLGHVGTFVRFDRFVELALPEASSGSMKKSSLGPWDSGTAVGFLRSCSVHIFGHTAAYWYSFFGS